MGHRPHPWGGLPCKVPPFLAYKATDCRLDKNSGPLAKGKKTERDTQEEATGTRLSSCP